ncbi:MAG TPA: hypothetical protein PK413_11120 [Thermoanaerobaculia bacterium]|nr:hypothetical protein [Thermoanaerobaculia bacterium]
MRSRILLVLLLLLGSAPAFAQFQPFGMDVEWIGVGDCNPYLYRSDAYGGGTGYCPLLEAAARAGAQYVRFLTLWRYLEPNPPTGVPQPGVPGNRTGQHSYAWDTDPYGNQWDYYVNYCSRFSPGFCSGRPYQVIFTHVWAPAWARGSSCVDCSPLSGNAAQCGDSGRSVQSGYNGSGYFVPATDILFDYYYNFARHFQGRVRFYGVWNEPNNSCNFDSRFLGTGSGSYLNDFVSRYLFMAWNGVHQADPSAQVIAPELLFSDKGSCGGWFSCDWYNSWLQPMWQYFSSSLDIIGLHRYPDRDHTQVRDNVQQAYLLTGGSRQIWMTEVGYNYSGDGSFQSNEMYGTYVDNFNYTWMGWQKTFYHDLWGGEKSLLNQNLTPRPAFSRYQSMTGH